MLQIADLTISLLNTVNQDPQSKTNFDGNHLQYKEMLESIGGA